jgi:hypothetical protein
MLDAYEDQARSWLQRQPGMTAVEILKRLRELAPAGTFTDKHLRTVQRALSAWRSDAIRQWIDQCRLETDAPASTALRLLRSEGGQALRARQKIIKKFSGQDGPWTTFRVDHRLNILTTHGPLWTEPHLSHPALGNIAP